MNAKQKQAKIRTVLREYKAGTLKSSSGEKVTSPKQALAIALSEAGMSRKPKADMSDEYYMGFFAQLAEEEEEEEEGNEAMEDSQGKP
jgi:hypothetical protein